MLLGLKVAQFRRGFVLHGKYHQYKSQEYNVIGVANQWGGQIVLTLLKVNIGKVDFHVDDLLISKSNLSEKIAGLGELASLSEHDTKSVGSVDVGGLLADNPCA
jgi:hypothetical protein